MLARPLVWFGKALRDWWGEMYAMVLINLLWVLGTLLIVTAPPAAAALNALARRAAAERLVLWPEFFGEMKRYFLPSWGLALIDGLALAVIVANYNFWGRFSGAWVPWVQGLWGAVLLLWLLWQLYLLPALVSFDRPSVSRTMRRSVRLLLHRPVESVVLGALCLLAVTLSIGVVFPLLMATPVIIAIACNRATLDTLAPLGKTEADAEAAATTR